MTTKKTALITGASKGLGFQLALNLAKNGWNLIITGRNPHNLKTAKDQLSQYTTAEAKSGDVRDEVHLLELAELLQLKNWNLDLVVNNASALGVSPLRPLLDHPVDNLHTVFHTNIIAPLSLLQKVKSYLKKGAVIINISTDAAAEAYETWGAYGGSKAGMDHITAILGKENPDYRFYAFDPGDMRTDMHQAAFPGEDISDRPLPETYAVPVIVQLVKSGSPSGRYTVGEFKAALV
ncbi:MAG: SDR family oxidoreductase [Bacteroidota bacterium]